MQFFSDLTMRSNALHMLHVFFGTAVLIVDPPIFTAATLVTPVGAIRIAEEHSISPARFEIFMAV